MIRENQLQREMMSNPAALREKLRLARAGLVQSMEKYSNFSGCNLIIDSNGVIKYLNLQGLEIFEADCLRQQGWCLGSFIMEHDRPIFEEFLSRVFSYGMLEHCEVMFQTSTDRQVWVRMEAQASQKTKVCHMVLFDITDVKREEAYLAASAMKYRALFANMSTAFSYHKIIRGNQGNGCEPILMEANDAYGMMLGMPV